MNQEKSRADSLRSVGDVDVIGGSAAGLFAAYLLARDGKRVRLFDANDVLRTESRTLITTAHLSEVLGFFPYEAVCNKIERIELYSPQRSVTIPMQQPDLVVERSAVVRLLAKKALQAGVEIRGGCKFLNIESAQGGAKITIRDVHHDRIEEFTARTVVGADGTFSRVAKLAGGNRHETTPILQAIVKLPDGVAASTTQVWFEPDDTPYFYWLIPESQQRTAVGFIAEDGKSARVKLERFLARRGLKVLEMQAARIPAYRHATPQRGKISGADVYLVGDAAAHVKVTTVGGLVTGLRGAKAAAAAIVRRSDYLTELKPLRRELGLHLLIRSVLNGFQAQDYDRLLGLMDEKTIGVLGHYNRDQAVRMVCRLLLVQPRLLKFGATFARALWRQALPNRSRAQPELIESTPELVGKSL